MIETAFPPFLLALLLLFPKSAYAYIDPGAGSMLFQYIIAGLLAGGFFIKMSWKKIQTCFTSLFKKNE